jgi:hypothetical protein
LSGRSLCDELIARPEESYRQQCVLVYDPRNLKHDETMAGVGSQRHKGGKVRATVCNSVFQSLAASLLKLFQCFGVGYLQGEWNGTKMLLSPTLKIATALHTEIL